LAGTCNEKLSVSIYKIQGNEVLLDAGISKIDLVLQNLYQDKK
jgi:hypothetical protein